MGRQPKAKAFISVQKKVKISQIKGKLAYAYQRSTTFYYPRRKRISEMPLYKHRIKKLLTAAWEIRRSTNN